MNHEIKGSFDYLAKKRKWEILKTFLMFALSLVIFLLGYLTTKSKGNLLTVVAILGCLPASKSAVSMIMYLRIKGCTKSVEKQISLHIGKLSGYFNLYFTSYDKNYNINHLIITPNLILAFSDDSKINSGDFENHIEKLLNKDGIKDVTVKLFTDLSKYTNRLDTLNDSTSDITPREKIRSLLFSITL